MERLSLRFAQILITPRCTLRCKKCSVSSNLWDKADKSQDMSLKDFKETITNTFNRFRCIDELHIIGGEPLLNDDLPDMLDWLYKEHSAYINHVIVITNATIIPSDKLLAILKKSHFTLSLSNYTGTNPDLLERFKDVYSLLENNRCSYEVISHPFVDYGYESNEHESSFNDCVAKYPFIMCHEIRKDKIYYCTQARINNEIRKYGYEENGMSLIDSTNEELENYLEGKFDGHGTCKRCNGAKSFNYSCPMGEQMEGE